MIRTIALHEFRRAYQSTKLLMLLVASQGFLSLLFYWLTKNFFVKTQSALLSKTPYFLNITEEVIHPLFGWTVVFFLFITPLLAGNTLAQERKQQTLDLYLLSSLPTTQVVLGKFLGLFLIHLLLISPLALMIGFLAVFYPLDWGLVTSGALGVLLLLATLINLGLLFSSLLKEPLIGSLLTFVTLVLLGFLEHVSVYSPLRFLTEFSPLYHAKDLLSGLLNSNDLIFYLITSVLLATLTTYRLHREQKRTL